MLIYQFYSAHLQRLFIFGNLLWTLGLFSPSLGAATSCLDSFVAKTNLQSELKAIITKNHWGMLNYELVPRKAQRAVLDQALNDQKGFLDSWDYSHTRDKGAYVLCPSTQKGSWQNQRSNGGI